MQDLESRGRAAEPRSASSTQEKPPAGHELLRGSAEECRRGLCPRGRRPTTTPPQATLPPRRRARRLRKRRRRRAEPLPSTCGFGRPRASLTGRRQHLVSDEDPGRAIAKYWTTRCVGNRRASVWNGRGRRKGRPRVMNDRDIIMSYHYLSFFTGWVSSHALFVRRRTRDPTRFVQAPLRFGVTHHSSGGVAPRGRGVCVCVYMCVASSHMVTSATRETKHRHATTQSCTSIPHSPAPSSGGALRSTGA